jgi:hypothetical protein
MAKTTIVTMFYNLKRLKDASNSTRPLEFYLNNGLSTLKLNYPMVVFCDSETIDFIKSVRDPMATECPTEYIIKPLTEYDFYAHNFDIIEQNRKNCSQYNYPGQRNTTSYFLITTFKCVALLIAKQRNFFNTPYYAWVDLGCNHVLKNVAECAPAMLDNPNPKISACYIHYRSKEELADLNTFFKEGGPCGMAATVFTAEATYIERFYNAMMEIFNEQLCKQTGHSDEQVMTYCYDRYPQLFTIYNGEYYSILTNYHEPRVDLYAIKVHFIYNCMNSKRFDLAKEAIQRVLTYLATKSHLNEQELDVQTEITHLYNHRCK